MNLDSSFTIRGASFTVNLPCIDACHPVHYIRRLLIFRCASDTQRTAQISSLKTGLKTLVARCPLLAGTIAPPSPDEAAKLPAGWRTIVPGPGLGLIVRDMRDKMVSFEELEASSFQPRYLKYEDVMPIPQDVTNEKPFAACKIQYTAIEGGTIVTLAMSHSVSDGGGANELLRILSEATRGAQDGAEPQCASVGLLIGLDRSAIRDLTSEEPFDGNAHPGYAVESTAMDAAVSTSEHPFTATAPEIALLKTISAAKLAQLKKDATPPGSSWISTHDALSALIWRTVLTIRSRRTGRTNAQHLQVPPSTPCQIFMPSDVQHKLNLPASYIGNAIYQLGASLPLSSLLALDGLKHAAQAIRSSITNATPSRVTSLIAESNKGWIPWAFPTTMLTTGVAMGTNWTSGVLYEHDWGSAFGPLVRFRYPDAGFNCVMPKLPNGSAEVMISCMPSEVESVEELEWIKRYCD